MELYWIWLTTLKYVGPILQKSLLRKFGNPLAIYEATEIDLKDVPKLNSRALQSLTTSKCLANAQVILDQVKKKEIKLLGYHDPLYPEHALHCPESPALLYYKGRLKPIANAVAVVGSRRCTTYGKRVAREIGSELAKRNITVISGFAKGIDSYAQAACVQEGGYSIGILANGVDVCYPKEQNPLYEQMINSGNTFISQYPPGTQPNFKYFLQRNALISAWTQEIVVVEATEKSGSLWTVQFADKYDRKVYAVPNQIGIPEGEGTNRLIAEGQAIPYLGIDSLELVRHSRGISHKDYHTDLQSSHIKDENPIVTNIKETPKTIKQLSINLQKSEQTLLEELLTLELEGKLTVIGNIVSLP